MLAFGMVPLQQPCCISGKFMQMWCSTPIEKSLVVGAGGLHQVMMYI